MGPHGRTFIFWMLSLSQFFTLLFHFHHEALQFFTFCHKGGVICIFEVIDISFCNLDSSLCFISLTFHTMYFAYKLNKQGDSIQPWCAPFPIWNQSIVPCLVLTVASWPAYRFLRRQVKKQQLEPDMEQWTGSKLGKEYIKAVYCHLAYLTSMQSTSCEILGWMKHKLE